MIGSKEIISKKNTAVKFNLEWAELPDAASKIKYEKNSSGTSAPSCLLQMLSGGRWISHSDNSSTASSSTLFNGITQQVQLFTSGQVIPASVCVNYADTYEQLNASTSKGLIRLTLNSSFGHSEYLRDFAQYIMEKSPDITDSISDCKACAFLNEIFIFILF